MRPISRYLILVMVLVNLAHLSATAADNNTKLVHEYFQAYNQHDIPKLLSYLAEDFKWFAVSDEKMEVVTEGKNQLEAALTDYFKNIPSTQSELLSVQDTGEFIQTLERASWRSKGQLQSQCSTAVYRGNNQKLTSVWYFPETSC